MSDSESRHCCSSFSLNFCQRVHLESLIPVLQFLVKNAAAMIYTSKRDAMVIVTNLWIFPFTNYKEDIVNDNYKLFLPLDLEGWQYIYYGTLAVILGSINRYLTDLMLNKIHEKCKGVANIKRQAWQPLNRLIIPLLWALDCSTIFISISLWPYIISESIQQRAVNTRLDIHDFNEQIVSYISVGIGAGFFIFQLLTNIIKKLEKFHLNARNFIPALTPDEMINTMECFQENLRLEADKWSGISLGHKQYLRALAKECAIPSNTTLYQSSVRNHASNMHAALFAYIFLWLLYLQFEAAQQPLILISSCVGAYFASALLGHVCDKQKGKWLYWRNVVELLFSCVGTFLIAGLCNPAVISKVAARNATLRDPRLGPVAAYPLNLSFMVPVILLMLMCDIYMSYQSILIRQKLIDDNLFQKILNEDSEIGLSSVVLSPPASRTSELSTTAPGLQFKSRVSDTDGPCKISRMSIPREDEPEPSVSLRTDLNGPPAVPITPRGLRIK